MMQVFINCRSDAIGNEQGFIVKIDLRHLGGYPAKVEFGQFIKVDPGF